MKLTLISIGTPETGRKLLRHLNIANNNNIVRGSREGDDNGEDGEGEWIFADPENDAYDKLALNRGWDK